MVEMVVEMVVEMESDSIDPRYKASDTPHTLRSIESDPINPLLIPAS